MDVMVVYSSRTGNTKKLAKGIFAAIPGDSKDMLAIEEYAGKDADTYFVGFWTDQGTCDMSVVELLAQLHGKNVALFGTCGAGAGENYYRAIEDRVKIWIPDDDRYLGMYMCQGKMPIQVRRRYEALGPEEAERKRALLANFDEAMLHPDEEDVRKAAAFAIHVMERTE